MRDELMSPWPDFEAGETWADRDDGSPRGGDAFAAMHAAHRLLNDRIAGAVLRSDLVEQVSARLIDLANLLAEHQGSEAHRWDGWRPDLPGRALACMPPYLIDYEDETTIRASVTFSRFFLGGNGAAHGGTLPLLFDDLLGRMANHHQPGVARTAFLKTNYRRVTPLDSPLRAEVSLDRIDGRKRWCTGRLLDAEGNLLADVESLFLQLLPGQA